MIKQSILTTIMFFTISAVIISCGNGGQNTITNSQLNEVEEKNIENPKVEISGIYLGIDNFGTESTIILRSGGSMVVQTPVSTSVGRWSGDAENVSLYLESDEPSYYDKELLLGTAKITQLGLQIIGGQFYSRQ